MFLYSSRNTRRITRFSITLTMQSRSWWNGLRGEEARRRREDAEKGREGEMAKRWLSHRVTPSPFRRVPSLRVAVFGSRNQCFPGLNQLKRLRSSPIFKIASSDQFFSGSHVDRCRKEEALPFFAFKLSQQR